jgi:Flp pilus assembly protein TadG
MFNRFGGIRGRTGWYWRDESASTAIVFALALIPLMGAVGAALDYTAALRIRSALQATADAAALDAVSTASASYAAAQTMTVDGPVPGGANAAVTFFNAQNAGRRDFSVSSVSATVDRANGSVTSSVQFSAQVTTSLLQLVHVPTITVTGTSVATRSLATYVDFYLLLDNTPSMGVGATQADIDTMVAHTPDQCAFACHDLSNPNNYYNLAKRLGVTMRIDVVHTATQQLMDTMSQTEAAAGVTNLYRAAIYSFGPAAQPTGQLYTVSSLTSNLSAAKSRAGNIDLMTVNVDEQYENADTPFDTVLPAMNRQIPNPGPGTSAAPQKVMFFVTDGITDEQGTSCSEPLVTGYATPRCIEPINTSLCAAIKSRGVKLAVLYTTYLALPTNTFYNDHIAPWSGSIWSAVQSCASPGLAFQVTQSQDISQAMKAMFFAVLAQQGPHLTQ